MKNELFKKLIMEQLWTVYQSKGVKVDKTEEALILNINKLAEPSAYLDNNGNPKQYIPLPIKELAWKIMYPEGCIKVVTKLIRIGFTRNDRDEEICCHAECYLFRTLEEMEKGLFVQMLEKDFFYSLRYLNDFKTDKERFEALRPYAQAIITSHCLTKFGLGLGVDSIEEDLETVPTISGDTTFNPVDEAVVTKQDESPTEDFTESITADAETPAVKKTRGRKKKGEAETATETPVNDAVTEEAVVETPVEEAVTEEAVVETPVEEAVTEETVIETPVEEAVTEETVIETPVEEAVTEEVVEETISPVEEPVNTPVEFPTNDGVQTTLFEQDATEESIKELSYEEALAFVCQTGKHAGNNKTLGEILETDPTNFKFLYNKAINRMPKQEQVAMKKIVAENKDASNLVGN